MSPAIRRFAFASLLLATAVGVAASAAVLTRGDAPAAVDETAAAPAPRWDSSPVRGVYEGLRLEKLGWTYDCMECHRLLKEPRWTYERPMVEHTHIRLDHGANRFCLNCHHPTNRNAFVDYDGTEIPQDDPVQLCAKCHGVVYRDWKAGIHGRRNGYWDASRGEQTSLRCVQCHDPHAPAFKPLTPMPGPRRPGGETHAPVAH